MPKRADPDDQLHYVSDLDKQWVRQHIADGKTSVAKLAKICGVSRQAIYLLLGDDTRHVAYWPKIVKALGGHPPSESGGTDARLQEIVRRWPEMSDDDRALVEAIALRVARKT